MESNWGRGPLTLGLGSAGCTLAARFLGSPSVVITNLRRPEDGAFRQWFISLETDIPWFAIWSLPLDGHPYFPFGFPVDPP